MELPSQLKSLYRHWEFHSKPKASKETISRIIGDKDLLADITWFIKERIQIWKKKTAGEQQPYTEDPILSTYRFCNIFREFDRQTIEFHALLTSLRDDFPLWAA